MKSNESSKKSYSQSQRNKADPIQIIAGIVVVVVIVAIVWLLVPKTSKTTLSVPVLTPTNSNIVSSNIEPVVVTVEPTLVPTETLIVLTPTREAVVSFTVRIVGNKSPASSHLELWLEFSFKPGDTLLGSQVESALNNGILELTLPSGEKKTLKQVPHSLTDSEITSDLLLPEGTGIRTSPPPAGTLPLNGFSFENYSNSPNGPQIRIPLEKLSDIAAKGNYQVSWQSDNLSSNTVVFEWDGSTITIH